MRGPGARLLIHEVKNATPKKGRSEKLTTESVGTGSLKKAGLGSIEPPQTRAPAKQGPPISRIDFYSLSKTGRIAPAAEGKPENNVY